MGKTVYVHYLKNPETNTAEFHSWCIDKEAHKRFLKERNAPSFITKKFKDDSVLEDLEKGYSLKKLREYQYESVDGIYSLLGTDAEDSDVEISIEALDEFMSMIAQEAIEYFSPNDADTVVQLTRIIDSNTCTIMLDVFKLFTSIHHRSFYGTELNRDNHMYEFLLPF